jgi:hypothetical protein
MVIGGSLRNGQGASMGRNKTPRHHMDLGKWLILAAFLAISFVIFVIQQ